MKLNKKKKKKNIFFKLNEMFGFAVAGKQEKALHISNVVTSNKTIKHISFKAVAESTGR